MHLHLTLSWIVLVIARLKLLLLALHVKFFKWSFLVGVKVYDIKAGPPTPTTVLLYLSALNTKIKLPRPLMVGRFGWFMVINATFIDSSVISWQSYLLVEETEVLKENHRTTASHWQTISHNVVLSTLRHELTTLGVIGNDCTCSCKFNYHAITATTAPYYFWVLAWRVKQGKLHIYEPSCFFLTINMIWNCSIGVFHCLHLICFRAVQS
jgi:hypothetical protein